MENVRDITVEFVWSKLIPIKDINLYDLSGWGIYEFFHQFPEAKQPTLLYVGQTANAFRNRLLWDRNYYRSTMMEQVTHVRLASLQFYEDTPGPLTWNEVSLILLKTETYLIKNDRPVYNQRLSYKKIPFNLKYITSDEQYKIALN